MQSDLASKRDSNPGAVQEIENVSPKPPEVVLRYVRDIESLICIKNELVWTGELAAERTWQSVNVPTEISTLKIKSSQNRGANVIKNKSRVVNP